MPSPRPARQKATRPASVVPAFARVVRGRRSVRAFARRALPKPLLRALLDLARQAPSSMNGQPWRFFVLRSTERKRALAEIKNKYCSPDKREYAADFLVQAPAVVVICVERDRSWKRDVENGVFAA